MLRRRSPSCAWCSWWAAAPSKSRARASRVGGPNTLRLNLQAEIPDLDSTTTADAVAAGVLNNVMEGLYRLDEDEQPQPAMAQSVEISDDKLTYIFTLRDGVKWSNGDPVTAQDFEYAWLRAMDPETAGQISFLISKYIRGLGVHRRRGLGRGRGNRDPRRQDAKGDARESDAVLPQADRLTRLPAAEPRVRRAAGRALRPERRSPALQRPIHPHRARPARGRYLRKERGLLGQRERRHRAGRGQGRQGRFHRRQPL